MSIARLAAVVPARLAGSVTHFAATLRDLADPCRGLPLLLWSVVYWALTVVQNYLMLHACGLGLAEAAVIVGIVGLSIRLPGGPAQVGSYQVGSVLALGLFVPAADLDAASNPPDPSRFGIGGPRGPPRGGYDPAFGARPLKRLVQQTLLDPLATEILSGKLRPGSKVVADLGQDSDGEPRVVLRPAE